MMPGRMWFTFLVGFAYGVLIGGAAAITVLGW